jgi:coenzyme F420-reducing hydrogenase delta subunit
MEPERVRMFNLSSAMASNFVEAAEEMTNQIQNLGSNPLKNLTT